MRISKVEIVIDGVAISGFSKFKENDIEVAQTVELADGSDFVDVPPVYGFSLTVVPESGADREWLGVKDATAIVYYQGGKKVTYTGVKTLKVIHGEHDGKAAKEYQVDFFAKDRSSK